MGKNSDLKQISIINNFYYFTDLVIYKKLQLKYLLFKGLFNGRNNNKK